MNFKHTRDARDWQKPPITDYDTGALTRLEMLLRWIELFCLLAGWGELTVTSYWRPDDEKSYHSILQAVDIRTKGKPLLFKTAMMILSGVLRSVDPTLQIYLHKDLWGTAHEHIHVAIKDGKLDNKRSH